VEPYASETSLLGELWHVLVVVVPEPLPCLMVFSAPSVWRYHSHEQVNRSAPKDSSEAYASLVSLVLVNGMTGRPKGAPHDNTHYAKYCFHVIPLS
jgi:hypothetical protein